MFPSVDIGVIQAQADMLTNIVERMDPDAVPLADAPGMWLAFDRIERLSAGAKLLLARWVDDSNVWQQAGDRDAGVWMARHQGSSVAAARVGLATSKRLAKLDATAGAVRRGELSVPQAESIADAAAQANKARDGQDMAKTADEEGRLLGLAREASLGELREECGRVKAKADPDPEERQRRIRANRRLRQGANSDGAWSLWGTGPVEDGGELNAVLGPIVDEIFHEAHRRGHEESRDAYAWDALIEMARRAHHWVYGDADNDADHPDPDSDDADDNHDTDTRDDSGAASERGDANAADADKSGRAVGDAAPEPRGSFESSEAMGSGGTASAPKWVQGPRPRRRRRMNEKYLTLVRVDLDAMARGRVEGEEVCEIAGVTVPVSVARQVLGESVLKLVLMKGQDVMSVTHLGRGPNAAQRIALRWLSPTCTVLGCNRTDLEHDHRRDWHITHHTRLDELDDICTHHHDLKTRLGWALVDGRGKREMVPPDDLRHPAVRQNRDPNRDRNRDLGWLRLPDQRPPGGNTRTSAQAPVGAMPHERHESRAAPHLRIATASAP